MNIVPLTKSSVIKRLIKKLIFGVMVFALGLFLASCAGDSQSDNTTTTSSTTTTECTAATGQITTSAGSSRGGEYQLILGSGSIFFSNVNLTFYTANVQKEIVDVDAKCLDSITSWPGNGSISPLSPITVIINHAYIAQFRITVGDSTGVEVSTTNYAKFIVNSYQDGVVTVTYVPNL